MCLDIKDLNWCVAGMTLTGASPGRTRVLMVNSFSRRGLVDQAVSNLRRVARMVEDQRLPLSSVWEVHKAWTEFRAGRLGVVLTRAETETYRSKLISVTVCFGDFMDEATRREYAESVFPSFVANDLVGEVYRRVEADEVEWYRLWEVFRATCLVFDGLLGWALTEDEARFLGEAFLLGRGLRVGEGWWSLNEARVV